MHKSENPFADSDSDNCGLASVLAQAIFDKCEGFPQDIFIRNGAFYGRLNNIAQIFRGKKSVPINGILEELEQLALDVLAIESSYVSLGSEASAEISGPPSDEGSSEELDCTDSGLGSSVEESESPIRRDLLRTLEDIFAIKEECSTKLDALDPPSSGEETLSDEEALGKEARMPTASGDEDLDGTDYHSDEGVNEECVLIYGINLEFLKGFIPKFETFLSLCHENKGQGGEIFLEGAAVLYQDIEELWPLVEDVISNIKSESLKLAKEKSCISRDLNDQVNFIGNLFRTLNRFHKLEDSFEGIEFREEVQGLVDDFLDPLSINNAVSRMVTLANAMVLADLAAGDEDRDFKLLGIEFLAFQKLCMRLTQENSELYKAACKDYDNEDLRESAEEMTELVSALNYNLLLFSERVIDNIPLADYTLEDYPVRKLGKISAFYVRNSNDEEVNRHHIRTLTVDYVLNGDIGSLSRVGRLLKKLDDEEKKTEYLHAVIQVILEELPSLIGEPIDRVEGRGFKAILNILMNKNFIELTKKDPTLKFCLQYTKQILYKRTSNEAYKVSDEDILSTNPKELEEFCAEAHSHSISLSEKITKAVVVKMKTAIEEAQDVRGPHYIDQYITQAAINSLNLLRKEDGVYTKRSLNVVTVIHERALQKIQGDANKIVILNSLFKEQFLSRRDEESKETACAIIDMLKKAQNSVT